MIAVCTYLLIAFINNGNESPTTNNHNSRVINVSLADLTPPPPVDESIPPPKEIEKIVTPGLQNGRPVEVWVSVPFNFRLN